MAVGAVRIVNVTETETTMAVPLVAALLKAWLVDWVELFLELHLAVMNLNMMAALVRNMIENGRNEYKTESIISRT